MDCFTRKRAAHELGVQAEADAAQWFLLQFPESRLVCKNYRSKLGELDLIFESGRILVFVEVRARLAGSWVTPQESIGPHKQKCLVRTIELFLSKYRGRAQGLRLDLLSWNGKNWEHWPHVWGLSGQR